MEQIRTIEGCVTAPRGFKAAGVRCGIKSQGADLALIYSDRDCSAAGVFTRNAFKAAPVIVDQRKLASGHARVIVANSGNANACTGKRGLEDANAMCRMAGDLLGIPEELVHVASTGIIGVHLPMEKVSGGIRDAVSALSEQGGEAAARAIMTTDTRPKMAACELKIDGSSVRIGGICKGAGMICPNLATMLCFVTTDIRIAADTLQECLNEAVGQSFNCLTIDGDMSTNDTVLLFANGASGCPEVRKGTPQWSVFQAALESLCVDLAKAIARDGEGATKYLEVRVINAATRDDARAAALAIGNSALVKTAVFGQDPNWGRILCAAGRSGATIVPDKVRLYVGDVMLVEKGEPLGVEPEIARRPMLEKDLTITLDLSIGSANATVFTCDFSHDYVRINAEYHT